MVEKCRLVKARNGAVFQNGHDSIIVYIPHGKHLLRGWSVFTPPMFELAVFLDNALGLNALVNLGANIVRRPVMSSSDGGQCASLNFVDNPGSKI